MKGEQCCGRKIHPNKLEIRVWENLAALRGRLIKCQGWEGREKWASCIKHLHSRGQQLASSFLLLNLKLFQFRSFNS